jgi:hypothetical protein
VKCKAEGGRVSQEFEKRACARSSWRTPDAMQRSGPGSKTKAEENRFQVILHPSSFILEHYFRRSGVMIR